TPTARSRSRGPEGRGRRARPARPRGQVCAKGSSFSPYSRQMPASGSKLARRLVPNGASGRRNRRAGDAVGAVGRARQRRPQIGEGGVELADVLERPVGERQEP